jgi:hypothetical protein
MEPKPVLLTTWKTMLIRHQRREMQKGMAFSPGLITNS